MNPKRSLDAPDDVHRLIDTLRALGPEGATVKAIVLEAVYARIYPKLVTVPC